MMKTVTTTIYFRQKILLREELLQLLETKKDVLVPLHTGCTGSFTEWLGLQLSLVSCEHRKIEDSLFPLFMFKQHA